MSLNKAMLIGNVGRDPEVRYVDSDRPVATFSLATSEPAYTLPNGTQVAERTDWHSIIVWGRLAKLVEQYVRKGNKLFIEGSIHTRTYEDNNSIRRNVTEIWADKIEFCSVAPSADNKQ
ncbi:MAG: single-stranded DNA-binding protein [Bacteroidales bacterium]|nr:single-stranded DNA-binding protein [Bacteroidales bacterium]